MTPGADVPSGARARNGATLAASLGVVIYLWTLNYNKLGSFYDYSTLTDAAGKLAAGLHPFRDYSSPVQSFSIWLAYACELLFGPRFLALSYGNLILTFALFFSVARYARKAFSFPLALSIAMAVCVASTLQHAILWYDTLGLALLAAVTLKCADLLRAGEIRARDAALLATLLLATGMTKMNFYADAVCIVALFAILAGYLQNGFSNRTRAVALAMLGAAICVAPPFIESFANHVPVSTWVREVILKPGPERAGNLKFLLNPAFYILEFRTWWPGTILKCSVLICLIVYVWVAAAASKPLDGEQRGDLKARFARVASLGVFWVATMLLVVSNVEIESASLCFCLVGLAALAISGQFPGDRLAARIRYATIALTVYFLVVGTVSIARHSRVSYVLNTFPGITVPKDGEPAYFRGVELSPQGAMRVAHIEEALKKHSGVPVYWGQGLEIMNRVHPGITDPALPLWYHLNITVVPSDTPRIIDAIEHSGAGLVIVDRLQYDYPTAPVPVGLRAYMARAWVVEQSDDVIMVFRRREAVSSVHGSGN